MDMSLPDELAQLRASLRRYVDHSMIPHEKDATDADGKLKPEWRARFQDDMKRLGIWMFDVPEEYGGLGLGALARCVVAEELARTVALPARDGYVTGPSVRAILYECDAAQKEKYLWPVIRGEKRHCFAQTEANAGADPAAMTTFARRDGDSWVINGAKRFITGAKEADFMQLMAVTDKERRARGGISCFLVDMDTPGVQVTTEYATMMGDRPCDIVLDNVRVPLDALVGEEGAGFALAQRWLSSGRLNHGAKAVGVAERCLELAASYATQRVTFGKPLAEQQAIQFMLSDSYIDIHAGRLMLWDAASRLDNGEDVRTQCYVAKVFCDEMAFKVADRCMQIHGGMGLTTELPIERMWRQQRSNRITEGATEVMKMVIARRVLRDYAA